MVSDEITNACSLSDTYLLELVNKVTQQNEILQSIYVSLLWIIGVAAAIFGLVLLYKFIRLFY